MIFVLHYLLFNLGLPATLILLTLFLQTHTDASLSEIGALLMALPFVSILIKPLFCALADRQQAHRLYLMIALALTASGYGSLAIAPFFPDFVRAHGQLVWYLDIVGIVIGFSAFGVVWSLGDALAVNHAQMAGVTWSAYRVWGVVSWGAGGILIGQINELPSLPKYVPAFLLLVGSMLAEIVLLALWPNKHFVMGGSLDGSPTAGGGAGRASSFRADSMRSAGAHSPGYRASVRSSGSVRASPRMIGSVASVLVEDLSGSLRSSLKLGARKRPTLDQIIEQHQAKCNQSASPAGKPDSGGAPAADCESQMSATPLHELAGQQQQQQQQQDEPDVLSHNQAPQQRGTRMELSRMDSLSAASGHVIAHEITFGSGTPAEPNGTATSGANKRALQHQPVAMYMSSLSSQTSLSKATAARDSIGLHADSSPVGALSLVSEKSAELANTTPTSDGRKCSESGAERRRFPSADELQLVLLKLIVRGDKAIWKYLVIFTIFGALLTCHLSYFFVHLERLCRSKTVDFALVSGAMLAAHSVSEVFSFTVVVPYLVPLAGRAGALLVCALIYALRFGYYGFYLESASPYSGVPFELAHGIVYGIVYSLITDIACESVNQVDRYFPRLIERGLVEPGLLPARLKLQLRATMQGLFSGAFDGLGNGIGALFGGLYLDANPFTHLWRFCAYVCVLTMVLYPLTEWRALCGRREEGEPVAETKKANGKS